MTNCTPPIRPGILALAVGLLLLLTRMASAQSGAISGTVTQSSGGTAIGSLTVLLYDGSTNVVASATTASDGTYSVTGLAFGTYYARTQRNVSRSPWPEYLDTLYGGTLCLSSGSGTASTPSCRIDLSTPIVLSAGTPTATANFSLPPGGRISGRAYPLGSPRTAFAGEPVGLYSGSTLVATTQSVDSLGSYYFSGLNPGTYFVRTLFMNTAATVQDVWYQGVCAVCPGAQPTPITVTGGSNAFSKDLAFVESFGGISGTLTLPGFSSIPGGAGLPAIQVYASDGTLVHTLASPFMPAPVGNTVTWTISGLPAGTYYVRTSSFSAPPSYLAGFGPLPGTGYWVDQLYSSKTCVAADCDPRSGTPVTVTSNGITPGINFTLDFGAQISGTVPVFLIGSTKVEIFDSRGVLLPQRSGVQSGDASFHVYAILGLPPGTYYLLAHAVPFGVSEILYKDTPCDGCSVTFGAPVTLADGEQKSGIDFSMIGERKISGTIRSDASGSPPNQPLGAISVEAYSSSGQLARSMATLADGTYSIGGLAPGTYYVRTRNVRGFIDQAYNGHTCGVCDPLSGDAIAVAAGSDVSGIDFGLAQGQTISGQVLAMGGPTIANAGVLVFASSPASPAAHVTTDSFGTYQATVPSGSYFVQTDPIAGYGQQIYNGVACPQGNCPTGSATAVTAASTPVTGVNFNLPACALVISPVNLAHAAVGGGAYRQTFLALGATGSVRFVVSSGSLPPGLSLDPATGVLSGSPTVSGQFTFTVSAVDSVACAGSRTYTLDVPPCAFTLTPTSVSLRARGEPWMVLVSNTCGPFTATPNESWLSIQSPTSSSVGVIAAPNTGGPRRGTVTIGPRVFTVLQSGAVSSPPFGFVDAPADGVVVSGSVAISGWALDALGVQSVLVYRDPVTGEPPQLIFVGQATFVPGARPDVEAAYPSLPFSNRAGWGFLLLTNMLPNGGNGTFRFWVYAQNADLTRTLLGTKTINVNNASATAPFGAIDTPGQGATISGSAFVNFGWALTPQPRLIAFDGSTIQVLIDGVPVGTLTGYNFFRSDVSTLFPGLKNSGGPVGYRVIDTTALSEGLHTIAWLATDDGMVTTGIGSRYFTVSNSAWQPALRASFGAAPPAFSPNEVAQADPTPADSTPAVPPRVDGVDLGRKAASLASLPVDADGARTVTMAGVQSLQLSLGVSDAACSATYAGYHVVNGELRSLPVGSSLDPSGTFYWHPGPGYFGTYELLFVRTSCGGAQLRIPVAVTISNL